MKLWHDDIRPAPEGWTWARTNAEAIELLSGQHHHGYQITEISMDHDLGLDHLDPHADPELIYFAGKSSNGTGEELVVWMIENDRIPPKITIHSWNPDGAKRMAARFCDAGHSVTVAPFVYAR